MKNLRMSENIKRFITMASAGVMLVAGSMTVKAESKTATVDDVITAMQNGRKIEVEMTEDEIADLVEKAEKKIAKNTDLLPSELSQAYEALDETKKSEKEKQLAIVTMACDDFINNGIANEMTYPESIQFDKVCDDVCKQLKRMGHEEIYSVSQSKLYGEDTYTSLDVIMQRSEEIKDSKKETYVTAVEVDLGLHDDCYITTEETVPTTEEIDIPEDKKNPPTGMALPVIPVALSASAILATLVSKKKKEKEEAKVYKKTK